MWEENYANDARQRPPVENLVKDQQLIDGGDFVYED